MRDIVLPDRVSGCPVVRLSGREDGRALERPPWGVAIASLQYRWSRPTDFLRQVNGACSRRPSRISAGGPVAGCKEHRARVDRQTVAPLARPVLGRYLSVMRCTLPLTSWAESQFRIANRAEENPLTPVQTSPSSRLARLLAEAARLRPMAVIPYGLLAQLVFGLARRAGPKSESVRALRRLLPYAEQRMDRECRRVLVRAPGGVRATVTEDERMTCLLGRSETLAKRSTAAYITVSQTIDSRKLSPQRRREYFAGLAEVDMQWVVDPVQRAWLSAVQQHGQGPSS